MLAAKIAAVIIGVGLLLWYITGLNAEVKQIKCTTIYDYQGYRKATPQEYYECMGE